MASQLLKIKKYPEVLVIFLKGRIDADSNQLFSDEINAKMNAQSETDLILDLSKVEYMSSGGISILVNLKQVQEKRNRKLKIARINNAVEKLFNTIGILDSFDIYKTEKESFDSL